MSSSNTNVFTRRFPTGDGFMTESVRNKFIAYAVRNRLMPQEAPRMQSVVSLSAPEDPDAPIHFWQLFSILGQQPIKKVVTAFYRRVFGDSEAWFRDGFARIAPLEHHIMTQMAMWLDCFGAGRCYHGGEYRLQFHHHHNALALMTTEGANRWIEHMEVVLDEACSAASNGALFTACGNDAAATARVRCSINTFLGYFMDDYAAKFNFKNGYGSKTRSVAFGARNPPMMLNGKAGDASANVPVSSQDQAKNLLKLSEAEIRALGVKDLRAALFRHNVDLTQCVEKEDLIKAALRLVSQ